MSQKYRLILIALSFILLLSIGFVIRGNVSFIYEDFWFTSGLLLLVLLSLIDQPSFSKDSNIFVNAIAASISLLTVEKGNRDFLFWLFTSYSTYLMLTSYILLWIRNKPLIEEARVVVFISRLNRHLGKPETLFSSFFLWGAYKQFGVQSNEFNALFVFWVIFMLLNIPSLAKTIESVFIYEKPNGSSNAIGRIFGVQSKNTFMVKLYEPSQRMVQSRIFDFVEFKYSIDARIRKGMLLDTYFLNQEQWVKVLSNSEIEKIFHNSKQLESHKSDVIYQLEEIPENDYINRFVGIITENSTIGKVRFIYNSKIAISEGQLLEVSVQKTIVLYQVVEGITKIEQLEQKNQSGLIIGEAIQLGTWNTQKFQFEQYGWVPAVNSPVFLASDIETPRIEKNEYVIGKIPNTNYPVIINKDSAISHHLAIIGVTGTGKSIFARNLIREYLRDDDTKVICIDFTGEYEGKFIDQKPVKTIDDAVAKTLFQDIDFIEQQVAGNYNKDNDASRKRKVEVSKKVLSAIKQFLESDNKLSIFELPHVENTSGVLTYTKTFFRILFHIAKNERSFGKRICIVLEEAHTIVPEWNFSGVSDKISQPLLNSIAQIALQGRKYNVGLLVIAQRTANVSKTILTQCNTIVSFQEFDKTSSDFLSNYFGQEIVSSLPKLKFRQAIAAGKAFKSSVPMIFEVPFIEEAKPEG